jgi:hypothetical protein
MDQVKKSARPESDYFANRFGPKDNHPSILGHELIAEKLLQDLIKFQLIN